MIKQKIAAIAAAAIAATTMAVTAFAVENYNFNLHPTTSVTRVMTAKKTKEDYSAAVVNLQTGLSNDYVTFRIRTPEPNTQPATNYKDVYAYGKHYFAYFSGYGYKGDDYCLAASYDEGQWRSGTYVNGIWAP